MKESKEEAINYPYYLGVACSECWAIIPNWINNSIDVEK